MESHRTRLSFVRTQVLTSTDGGNTFDKEEEVEPTEEADDKVSDLFEHDRAILNKRGDNLSLYDQLQANKEKAEEEWAKTHNPYQAPKALDNEEVQFLEEQKQLQVEKDRETKQEEQAELNAFKLAQTKSHEIPSNKKEEEEASESKPESATNGGSDKGSDEEEESEDDNVNVVVREKKT